MAKNKHRKAVTARRKTVAANLCGQPSLKDLRPSKDKDLRHKYTANCVIPNKINNPNITTNKEGELVLNYNLDNLTQYREIKRKWKDWNKRNYPDVTVYKHGKILYHTKRRHPWYIITKGKQLAYHSKKLNWGELSTWVRVKSESYLYSSSTTVQRMTKTLYKKLLIEAKLKDWEKKHPRPVPKDNKQPDLFEAQFMVPWVAEHTEAREKIVQFVNQIGNRATVYARYVGDSGYPRKIATIKSDRKSFMISDGKYTNYDSKTVNKAQQLANELKIKNSKLIALKVVEQSQECIITPHIPLEERLKALEEAA